MQRQESETLEFKLRIDSQRKIAKTLVALANGAGGRVVIGVRDSGSVSGCRTDEEFFMIQGAAQVHTRPEVPLTAYEERWDGKPVLVVDVPPSPHSPHQAHDEVEDVWRVYVRKGAANFKANRVMVEALALRHQDAVKASADQLNLLHLIPTDGIVSASWLSRRSGLPIRTVEDGLAVLLRWELIASHPVDHGWRYAANHI